MSAQRSESGDRQAGARGRLETGADGRRAKPQVAARASLASRLQRRPNRSKRSRRSPPPASRPRTWLVAVARPCRLHAQARAERRRSPTNMRSLASSRTAIRVRRELSGEQAEIARAQAGGDGGIRTLDRALQPYNGLANRRLQPLGHISASATGAAAEICPTPEAIARPARSAVHRRARRRNRSARRRAPKGKRPERLRGDR